MLFFLGPVAHMVRAHALSQRGSYQLVAAQGHGSAGAAAAALAWRGLRAAAAAGAARSSLESIRQSQGRHGRLPRPPHGCTPSLFQGWPCELSTIIVRMLLLMRGMAKPRCHMLVQSLP